MEYSNVKTTTVYVHLRIYSHIAKIPNNYHLYVYWLDRSDCHRK
jgi:hypothetical protein